jgi:hypothetical protein
LFACCQLSMVQRWWYTREFATSYCSFPCLLEEDMHQECYCRLVRSCLEVGILCVHKTSACSMHEFMCRPRTMLQTFLLPFLRRLKHKSISMAIFVDSKHYTRSYLASTRYRNPRPDHAHNAPSCHSRLYGGASPSSIVVRVVSMLLDPSKRKAHLISSLSYTHRKSVYLFRRCILCTIQAAVSVVCSR